MNRKKILRSLFGVIAFGAIVLQSAAPIQAQEMQPPPPPPPGYEQQAPPPLPPPPPPPSPYQRQVLPPQLQLQAPPPPRPPIDTTGKMRLSLSAAVGFGFDPVDVGRTNDGDKVTISGGGGFGIDLGLGFALTPIIDLDFDLGGQQSTLTPSVTNADGTFDRSFLLATVKFKVPTSETGQFKWGFGLGSYNNGKLDIDTTGAINGAHTIVKYDDALGVHLTGEFERFIGPATSVNFGAKMYFVKYKAKSVTNNGATVPVSGLGSDVKDFDGSGMDFMIGINQYF